MAAPAPSAKSINYGPAHGHRVYVDNSVLSRLTDHYKSGAFQLSSDDIDALDAISDDESLDLVTSAKTLQEILRLAEGDHRVILKLLYRARLMCGPTRCPVDYAKFNSIMLGIDYVIPIMLVDSHSDIYSRMWWWGEREKRGREARCRAGEFAAGPHES